MPLSMLRGCECVSHGCDAEEGGDEKREDHVLENKPLSRPEIFFEVGADEEKGRAEEEAGALRCTASSSPSSSSSSLSDDDSSSEEDSSLSFPRSSSAEMSFDFDVSLMLDICGLPRLDPFWEELLETRAVRLGNREAAAGRGALAAYG